MAATSRKPRKRAAQEQTRPESPGHLFEGKKPIGFVDVERNFTGADDPDLYGLVCSGNCVSPEANDGDTVICSPREEPKPGDLVVVWRHAGGPLLKFLYSLPPWGLQQLSPESTVQGMAMLRMLNPPAIGTIRTDHIKAMHVVVKVVRKEVAA